VIEDERSLKANAGRRRTTLPPVYASAMSDSEATDAADVSVEYSPLERKVERDGVWVKISIFRGADDPGWLLEIEDHLGGSTVWDDPFETDQAALRQGAKRS